MYLTGNAFIESSCFDEEYKTLHSSPTRLFQSQPVLSSPSAFLVPYLPSSSLISLTLLSSSLPLPPSSLHLPLMSHQHEVPRLWMRFLLRF